MFVEVTASQISVVFLRNSVVQRHDTKVGILRADVMSG